MDRHSVQFDKIVEEAKQKGLRYNTGKRKWGMVHFRSLEPMIQVLEYGAHKYSIYEDEHGNKLKGAEIPIEDAGKYKRIYSGMDNWKGGLDKREILESMMRHMTSMLDGETHDPESGLPHMGHLLCNGMFYNYMVENYK